MATKKSGQKFIARNRAPRVQVEYDVELYGAEKTVNLPFVMGVMADLSGRPAESLPGLEERKFLDIDVASRRVPGAQHAHGAREYQRRSDIREHGRFLPGRRGPEGRCPQQAAPGEDAVIQSSDVHGWEIGSGRTGGPHAPG